MRGFTLIELMIGMTLGLLMLLVLTTLFQNTSRTNSEIAKVNALIENGRFSLQFLETDIVHAGFWGTHVPGFDNLAFVGIPADVPTAVPDPCLGTWSADAALSHQLIGIPVQVYAETPVSCTTMTNRRAGTNVLLVRHAEPCVPGEGSCEALTAGRVYFQASLCASDAKRSTLNLLADAADLAASGFDLRGGNCASAAELRRLISSVYYIRDGAVPTLMRIRYDGSGHVTEELIDGIEDFRVELGVDDRSVSGAPVDYEAAVAWPDPDSLRSPTNRGDGMPDRYVICPNAGCSAADLINTVVVRLFVLARSPDSSTGYTDTKSYCLGTRDPGGNCPAALAVTPGGNIKRHVFSTSVRLNNVSGRRETPPLTPS